MGPSSGLDIGAHARTSGRLLTNACQPRACPIESLRFPYAAPVLRAHASTPSTHATCATWLQGTLLCQPACIYMAYTTCLRITPQRSRTSNAQ